MVVQHNISAMTANRYYQVNNKGLASSLEKLASGYAINKAGDNAAGLAVSEKMRAQIGGLTQASKNAEDGISMVQTFEGALQETDSILQRMRTLAVQSANGSYQDDVDREAMQLEFDQLNDELNQIADTDYNGTVVLNGGQMADGLKAVDGKFDYANYDRDPKQLGSSFVNKVDYQKKFDDTDSAHGLTKADTAWSELNAKWDRKEVLSGTAGYTNGPESVDVSLKFNAEDKTWTVTGANNGADASVITTEKTNNGGYALQINGTEYANIVMDTDKLKNGDTMVLTLNNPSFGISAPTNAGAVVADTSNYTEGTTSDSNKINDMNLKLTLTNDAKDSSKVTEATNKLFDLLNGATVTATYKNDDTPAGVATAAGDLAIKLKDGTEVALDASGAFTISDGTKYYATVDAGKLTLGTSKPDGSAKDMDLISIEMTKKTKTTDLGNGTISYKIGIENNNYSKSAGPSVVVKEPSEADVSQSNAFEQSKATMTYADSMYLQVGARTKDEVNFTFNYSSNGLGDLKANMNCSARTDGLGTADLSLRTARDANKAIDLIDNAINKVSMVRATFGAIQNRLEHKINNIDTNTENITAAESRIRDTQMDKEMMKFTSSQILSQASQSMLAQANQLPQGVLQLLG